jgi:hypothetical protein
VGHRPAHVVVETVPQPGVRLLHRWGRSLKFTQGLCRRTYAPLVQPVNPTWGHALRAADEGQVSLQGLRAEIAGRKRVRAGIVADFQGEPEKSAR